MADQIENPAARAEKRLDAALEQAAVQDPRPHLRAALRQLKASNPVGFTRALAYFQEQLVPRVAGDADPLAEWLKYGRIIAVEMGPGREVEVGPSGRALPADGDRSERGLLLFLPDDTAAHALLLCAPRPWTRAQEATVELLIHGRATASAYEGR